MRTIVSILIIAVLTVPAFAQKPNKKERRMASRIEGHIQYLASDALAGRGNGSEGEQLSAGYIAKQFEHIGLEPKGEDGFFQHMKITTLRIAQPSTALMLGTETYTLFMEFYPLTTSVNQGEFIGEAINVSNGIYDSHLKTNNYEGKDVNGKAVLIRMEVPEMDNPHSHFGAWGGLSRRIETAKHFGAKAVIFYSENADNKPSGELKKMSKDLGVPVLFISKDLDSTTLINVDLKVDIMAVDEQASNVIGFIDHGSENTVVIGAHHDHLGLGEHGGSRALTTGEIHNGADDNASGVAALFELANIIKGNPKKFANNNYLFIAFTAEELGLLGSKHFVQQPTIPLQSINYMVNMDMIGKLDSAKKVLVINGVGTSPAWKVAQANIKLNEDKIAKIKTTESGIGASDHTSFYLANIPSVHFFTGQHEHYHKPSDDVEIVNYTGEAFVIFYICEWLEQMDAQGKVEFTKTKEDKTSRMSFKVTLGIMPDYVFDGEGLRVDGVKENHPGAAAGLQKGDIITSLNGTAILNIQDYMKVLSSLKKGQTVSMQYKRGEEYIDTEVTF